MFFFITKLEEIVIDLSSDDREAVLMPLIQLSTQRSRWTNNCLLFATQLQTLKQKLKGSSSHHNRDEDNLNLSGMYFNHSHSQENLSAFDSDPPKSSSHTSLNFISSYFPFSPIKDLRRKSIVGTPISNFLQGGSLFNFGRARKHARSPSTISITHSLTPSTEDISSDGNQRLAASRSMEDLTSSLNEASLPVGNSEFYRTKSDAVPSRERLHLLDPTVTKPRKSSSPPSPNENITYITSL